MSFSARLAPYLVQKVFVYLNATRKKMKIFKEPNIMPTFVRLKERRAFAALVESSFLVRGCGYFRQAYIYASLEAPKVFLIFVGKPCPNFAAVGL